MFKALYYDSETDSGKTGNDHEASNCVYPNLRSAYMGSLKQMIAGTCLMVWQRTNIPFYSAYVNKINLMASYSFMQFIVLPCLEQSDSTATLVSSAQAIGTRNPAFAESPQTPPGTDCRGCVSVWLCMHVHVCACMCMYLMSIYTHVWHVRSVHAQVMACICMYMYVYVRMVCICMYHIAYMQYR